MVKGLEVMWQFLLLGRFFYIKVILTLYQLKFDLITFIFMEFVNGLLNIYSIIIMIFFAVFLETFLLFSSEVLCLFHK